MGPGVGPEPARGVPEPPQQILAPQFLDVVAVLLLDLFELLVDRLGLDRLGGRGLGLLGLARLRSSVVGSLRFGGGLVGRLLFGLSLRLFGLGLLLGLVDIGVVIGRPAGTLTCAGGFSRAFGHICPGLCLGRLIGSTNLMDPRADPRSRLTTASARFSCADRLGLRTIYGAARGFR